MNRLSTVLNCCKLNYYSDRPFDLYADAAASIQIIKYTRIDSSSMSCIKYYHTVHTDIIRHYKQEDMHWETQFFTKINMIYLELTDIKVQIWGGFRIMLLSMSVSIYAFLWHHCFLSCALYKFYVRRNKAKFFCLLPPGRHLHYIFLDVHRLNNVFNSVILN